jgi:hypothetical protein
MRNISIGLLTSVFCLALLAVSSFESNAQSRPGMGAGAETAGYCPQGTHPKGSTGGPGQKVRNVTTDCVPDGSGGSSAQQKQQKK